MKCSPTPLPQQLQADLHKHLQRCEIEYIADHGGGCPPCLNGLTEAEEIKSKLREIGYRIKIEETDAEENGSWIVTTSNINVYVDNTFCFRVKRPDKPRKKGLSRLDCTETA